MFEEVVDWIRQNYSNTGKIVEVGIGHRVDVAQKISEALPHAEVLVTDKDESPIRLQRIGRVRAVADDVMFPSVKIYQGTSLIYSLNPPGEILEAMEKLTRQVGADLLVVPIADERHSLQRDGWRELVVKGRIVGWLLSKN